MERTENSPSDLVKRWLGGGQPSEAHFLLYVPVLVQVPAVTPHHLPPPPPLTGAPAGCTSLMQKLNKDKTQHSIHGTVGPNYFHQIPAIKVLINRYQEGLEGKGIE